MTTIAELGVVVRSQGVQQAGRDLDKFNQSAGKADRAAASLATTAKRAFAAVATAGVAYAATRSIMDNARAYENLTGKMRLFLQDQKAIFQAQTQLFGIAQRAGVELGGVTDLYVKLSGASEDLRNNQTKLLRVVELFSKGLTVSGADAAAAAASTRQFAQALASGTLRGDEFVSVMEGAPRVAKALADGLGVSTGELRKLAAQGKLTAETVTEALLRGGAKIDTEYNRLPLTLDRAVQRMKNSWLQLIGQTNEAAGATQGMAQAIDGLGRAMSDPQTIAAFQSTVGWLARVTAGAISAIGALNEYFAANAGKGLASLQNRRTALETELFGEQRAQRRSWIPGAEENAPRVRALKAEIAELDRLITARQKAARTDWVEGRVVSKAGAGRWSNVTSEAPVKPLSILDTATGKVSRGGSSRGAMPDFLDEDRRALERMIAETERADEAFSRWAATLAGPVAEAEYQHQQNLREIEALGRQAGRSAGEVVDLKTAETRRYHEQRKEIEASLNPMRQLLDSYAAEIDAMGRGNAERAVMNELRRQGIDLASKEAQANIEAARALDEAARRKGEFINLMDAFRGGAVDAFTDVVTGVKSAKDAFKDLFDNLAAMITRMIAERWMAQLFGGVGTTGSDTKGGGWLASIFGALFGGKGFASGGYTGDGPRNEIAGVVHRGEYVIPATMLDNIRNGRMPAANESRGGASRRLAPVNQTIVVQGKMDGRTAQQIAHHGALEYSKAMRRA